MIFADTPVTIDGETFTFTITRGPEYGWSMCFCGRVFRGRDLRRVEQHYRRHAKRCTRAKKAMRAQRKNPPPYLDGIPQVRWQA